MTITVLKPIPIHHEPVHPFSLNAMLASTFLIAAIGAVVIAQSFRKPRHHDRHDLY